MNGFANLSEELQSRMFLVYTFSLSKEYIHILYIYIYRIYTIYSVFKKGSL